MDKILAGDIDNNKILYKDEESETSSSNSSTSDCNLTKYDVRNQYKNEILKQRVETLRKLMDNLRVQLKEEKSMWKQEIEEVNNKMFSNSIQQYSSVDDTESKYSDTFNIYEKKLLQYQEALHQAREDKKYSLQRQIAISNYKRRLLEVENMCNIELLRVKQNVQFLEPLKTMISDWNTDIDRQENKDTFKFSNEIKLKEMPKEIDMSLELLGNELQSNLNENNIPSKTFPNSSMPQLSSSSTIWQSDDSYITHSQSTIWYSECQTKFNAY